MFPNSVNLQQSSAMAFTMQRWVGKVAVVTGASVGIGAAICDALVEHGVIVAGIARRTELIEERAKKLAGKKGKLYAVQADLTKEEDIVKAFKWITEKLGPVHILINNAGSVKDDYLSEGKLDDWKAVFDVNVFALLIATREAVQIMKKNKINGQIIHINSTVGHKVIPGPKTNVYAATKHAVTALAETLRYELIALDTKIKVTNLSPGLVATELTTLNKNNSEETRKWLSTCPIMQPEDIAGGVIFVLTTPEHVQVQQLTIKPVGEMY